MAVYLIVVGVVAVVVTIRAPRGLWGLLGGRGGRQILALRRWLVPAYGSGR